MENKNESQSYKSVINNEKNKGIFNDENKSHKSQSNTRLMLNKLERHEESLLKEKKSHKVPLSQYYNKELSKIYANFLKRKEIKYPTNLMKKMLKNF